MTDQIQEINRKVCSHSLPSRFILILMYYLTTQILTWIVGKPNAQGKHRTMQQTQSYSPREQRIKEKGACIQQHFAKQRWLVQVMMFFFHLTLSRHPYMESHDILFFSIYQVYGQGLNEHPTDTAIKYSIVNKDDESVPVNLELSLPQNVESEKSGTPSLG